MFRIILPGTAVLVATISAMAHDHHDHGSHQHGVPHMTLAFDGKDLLVELEFSGADIVGFETAAVTDSEKQVVADAISELTQTESVLQLNGDCSLISAEVTAEGYEGDKAHGGHAAFHAHYAFQCPAAPSEALVSLFQTFPAIAQLQVEGVAPSGALRQDLTPDHATLRW